jgi:uncharacterized protein YjdB
MAIKKVAWDAVTHVATVLLEAGALPSGSVEAGTYEHPDPTDATSRNQYSHVTYQHVRDILFTFANIQDMSMVIIVDDTPVPATSITVLPNPVVIPVASEVQLVPTVVPAEADPRVTYQSDNSMVAEVDAKGMVYGRSIGETQIYVRPFDGTAIFALVPVTVEDNYVEPIDLTGVTVNPATVTISLAGTVTAQLTTTPIPADATDPSIASWSSSTPAIATVSATGLVTGLTVGTTTITAHSTAGPTGTKLVTVTA